MRMPPNASRLSSAQRPRLLSRCCSSTQMGAPNARRPYHPTRIAMRHRFAILISLGLLAGACGGQGAATSTTFQDTTTTPTPVVLTGTVDLAVGGFDGDRETLCWGHEGYDDIQDGANVVARDGDGNTLGVTDLGGGEYYTPPDGEWFETTCRFSFEVELVSEAPRPEVRHRKRILPGQHRFLAIALVARSDRSGYEPESEVSADQPKRAKCLLRRHF